MFRNYYLYILTNPFNTVLYIGITNNLVRRLIQHRNHTFNNSFSEKYNLTKLIYFEIYEYIDVAIYREKQLKKWRRQWKNNLIKTINPTWKDLSCDWEEFG